MKLLTIATILAVVQTGAFFSSRAEVPPGAETIRSGRAIQLDGFLIDWQETMRKPWAGSSLWFRDAAATPEGLAGYAISRSPSCSTWTIFFVAREPSQPPLSMKIPAADTATGSYCVRHERLNGIATLTIEWLVPWDSITVNAWGDYAVRFVGPEQLRGQPCHDSHGRNYQAAIRERFPAENARAEVRPSRNNAGLFYWIAVYGTEKASSQGIVAPRLAALLRYQENASS